jgi:hypothetical protein
MVYKVSVSPKALYQRYLQMRSTLEVLKVMLYDYGITYSPTVVRKFELSQYLVGELDKLGFTNYTHVKTGVPLVLDLRYLDYVKKVVHHKHTFQTGLNLIIGYLQYKQELEYLEKEYSFNTVKFSSQVTLKSQTRQVKLSEGVSTSDFPVWLPKSINKELTSFGGYTELEVSLSLVYYNYVRKQIGEPLSKGWTFLNGLKRHQEETILPLILEGAIATTNLKLQGFMSNTFNFQAVSPLLREQQEKVLKKTLEKNSDLMIKAITPYKVLFTKKEEGSYPLFFNYICWDSDNQEPLSEINLYNGLGGEFTRVQGLSAKIPYYLTTSRGKKELFYKVESKSQLHSGNVHLERFLQEFVKGFGVGFQAEGLLIPLSSLRKTSIKRSLERLKQKGVSLIDASN